MKITAQFVMCDDDGHEETCINVVVLEKTCQRIEHLGDLCGSGRPAAHVTSTRIVPSTTCTG
jgi:hypothetical protein